MSYKQLSAILAVSCLLLINVAAKPEKISNVPKNESSSIELLKAIVIAEIPGSIIKETHPERGIFELSNSNQNVKIHLSSTPPVDLNRDGTTSIVVGFEFCDIDSRKVFKDFVAIYSIKAGHPPDKIWSKCFDISPLGEFEDLHLQDLTGDGTPDICIRYVYGDGGMIRWNWEETYLIIGGRAPFKTFFEYSAGEGWEDVHDNGQVRRAEIEIKDIDGDGISEIIVETYKGDDTSNLSKLNEPTEIYHLSGDRYNKK